MAVIWMGTGRFGVAYDADAQAYITAVEAADAAAGQSGGLEVGVKDAINAFVVGCKADGTFSAIKACCILAGARTLNGALSPLVGTAPTNVNFVAGDYDRKTGLWPGSTNTTKYLLSNRLNNADPQNSKHGAAYLSETPAVVVSVVSIMRGSVNSFTLNIQRNLANGAVFRVNNATGQEIVSGQQNATGFWGVSRSSSASYVSRVSGTNYAETASSATPNSDNIAIFANSDGTNKDTCRIAFYSMGESLDLALLDARVTTLVNAIAAAIP
jgi:hypothetical protein